MIYVMVIGNLSFLKKARFESFNVVSYFGKRDMYVKSQICNRNDVY